MNYVPVKMEQIEKQIKIEPTEIEESKGVLEPTEIMESENVPKPLQAIWINNADVTFHKNTVKDLEENIKLDIVTRNVFSVDSVKTESSQQFSSEEDLEEDNTNVSQSQVDSDTHGCSTTNLKSKRKTPITERTCPNCSYVAKKVSELKTHLLVHSDELFLCTQCDKSYTSKLTLDSHILRYHKNDDLKAVVTHKIQKCSECDFEAFGMKKLESHFLTVHEGYTMYKKYKCEYCDYRSNNKTRISGHELTHTGGKLFNCQFCKSGYNVRARLEDHLLRIHKQQFDNIQEIITHKILQCERCPFETVIPSSLSTHVLVHGAEFTKNLEPFKCYHCPYETYVKKRLTVHVQKHLRKNFFCCSECDKNFTNKLSLDFHVMKVHVADKPELVNTVTRKLHKCDVCHGIFKHLVELQKHKCRK